MSGDDWGSASEAATTFMDLPVVHFWDPDRSLGELFSKALNLKATAWDIYLLYAPGVLWVEDQPPQPTFWMHQLPASAGTDWRLQLNAGTMAQELLKLSGRQIQPSSGDVAFLVHCKGLLNLVRESGEYSIEEIRQVVEELKESRS